MPPGHGEPLDDRLRQGFRTLRYWEKESDQICTTSHHKESAMVPSSAAERINEVLQDLSEAGADPEWVRALYFGKSAFSEARDTKGKIRYDGVRCSSFREQVREILRKFAHLEPGA